MFQSILKWTLKYTVEGSEKEVVIHLDQDTPLQVVEQVAMQMIAHCSKIKEMAGQQPVAPIAKEQEG